MDGQYTLQRFALQLKNQPRTLRRVARVFQKIIKELYDTYFPNAEAGRPGPLPNCPDSDILAIGWLLEYIGEDSENKGYRRIEAELKMVFPALPERSRFNRRRRNLAGASEVLRCALIEVFAESDVFIVDSFPLPVCDFKRAGSSKSDLKWADASGTLATYGHCATKGLGTFFGFRGHLLTTVDGVPVDFAIASADIDDREVLSVLCERGTRYPTILRNKGAEADLTAENKSSPRYPIILGDKGYISGALQEELLDTEGTVLLPTLRSNQKDQYPGSFRKLQVKLRRRVETTIGQLVDQFNVSRVRARAHWGLQTRMSNKFGACLLGAFLNQCLDRPLMKLKDLVLA